MRRRVRIKLFLGYIFSKYKWERAFISTTQLKDNGLLLRKQRDEKLCSHDNSMVKRYVLLLLCHFLLSGLPLLTSSGKAQMRTVNEKTPAQLRSPTKTSHVSGLHY